MTSEDISDIRLTIVDSGTVLAYAAFVLFDAIAIDDAKLIGADGGRFVAMPSKRRTAHCPECGENNHRLANYCNECGGSLESLDIPEVGTVARSHFFASVAWPVTQSVRDVIESALFAAYDASMVISGSVVELKRIAGPLYSRMGVAR